MAFTSLTIPNTITHIEGGAFTGCKNLRYISLPIGEEVPVWTDFYSLFEGTSQNLTVTLTNGTAVHIGAFENCGGIIAINLPDTVETLCDNAFAYCTSLQRINIPASITFLNSKTFKGCTDLQVVELKRTAQEGITIIEKGTFEGWKQNYFTPKAIAVNDMDSYNKYVEQFEENGEMDVADLVTYKELRYVPLDDGTYSVKRRRIYLQGTIEIPAYFNGIPITIIGQDAFKGCNLITTISVPSTVTEICNGAFYGCEYLQTLEINRHISSGIINIQEDNFDNLKVIILPDSQTCEAYKERYPQYSSLFTYIKCELNYELKDDGTYKIVGGATGQYDEIYIPAYYNGIPVTEIADEAFVGGDFVMIIFMGESNITTIGDRAFYGANFYEGISLPSSVQYIGYQAFANSTLRSINLRSYVYVAEEAFDSSVTIYTDAYTVPDEWHFINNHYIFFNCGFSEAGNYVETICIQENDGYKGDIFMPYRPLYSICLFGSNQAVPYQKDNGRYIEPYSFYDILDGALPIGERVYVIMVYVNAI